VEGLAGLDWDKVMSSDEELDSRNSLFPNMVIIVSYLIN
jgi:hypothetical protein